MQLLFYTDVLSPRVNYIVPHIFEKMLGINVVISHSISEFSSYRGPKVCYTLSSISGGLRIVPAGLLSDNSLRHFEVKESTWNSLPTIFEVNGGGDLPFDIFSGTFYLITRYEEYLNEEPDAHGRFKHTNSVAHRIGFLSIPLVDMWVKELGEVLQQKFPAFRAKHPPFYVIPTIDIDNAYAYKGKGIAWNLLGLAKDVLNLRASNVFRRLLVCSKLQNDPYDSYSTLFDILKPYPQALWFLLGGRFGAYDRNLPIDSKPMQRIIHQISDKFYLGAHPSYRSGSNSTQVDAEIRALSKVVGYPVRHSRQHYLRFSLPHTYRVLAELGITSDYSMGYQDAIGFRASTSVPFNFYDLLSEKELPLSVIPFQVMDRSLLKASNGNAQWAINAAVEIAAKVQQHGGCFVPAWHNESLSGADEWRDWKMVLPSILEQIEKNKLQGSIQH